MKHPKSFLGILGKILGCLSIPIVITFVAYFGFYLVKSNDSNSILSGHPSDKKMIENFQQHRSELDQLASMLVAEKEILVIFPDTEKCQIANQKLISTKENPRCAKLVELFKAIGSDWAYAGRESIWLPISSYGLSVSGSTKGYFFSTSEPTFWGDIVGDTDKAPGSSIFRHLDGNWYIYYESY